MLFLKKSSEKKNRLFQQILLKGKQHLEVHQIQNFPSKALDREVRVDIYLPPRYFTSSKSAYPVVFFNDGQDMEALSMLDTLSNLYTDKTIKRCIIVAIHAGDRMQEYGVIDQADYKERGAKATAYRSFMLDELIPFLRQRYKLSKKAAKTTIAGFSLGGLSAFDLAWKHPKVFGQVGVFSGSLWWRSEEFTEDEPDANRIVHDYLAKSQRLVPQKFWLQAGTEDEKADRNNNGIIDAIDDTLDLIKALENIGYEQGPQIKYVEVIGGEHNPETWGRIMPDFLIWAVGK
ncbi:MAG: esterase family protein [Saprospiraceae bacterium]|nr:esterase family protein [Saprospiraceae bacterium]